MIFLLCRYSTPSRMARRRRAAGRAWKQCLITESLSVLSRSGHYNSQFILFKVPIGSLLTMKSSNVTG